MSFVRGDRVQFKGAKGTVAKVIPKDEWHDVEVVVVEWDDDSRGTVWASDLTPEDDLSEAYAETLEFKYKDREDT